MLYITRQNKSRWRHNWRDSVSNYQPHHCILNRSLRRSLKKTSKFRVNGICVGNSPGTAEFPAQMASNAENVSTWWRHHANYESLLRFRGNRSVAHAGEPCTSFWMLLLKPWSQNMDTHNQLIVLMSYIRRQERSTMLRAKYIDTKGVRGHALTSSQIQYNYEIRLVYDIILVIYANITYYWNQFLSC